MLKYESLKSYRIQTLCWIFFSPLVSGWTFRESTFQIRPLLFELCQTNLHKHNVLGRGSKFIVKTTKNFYLTWIPFLCSVITACVFVFYNISLYIFVFRALRCRPAVTQPCAAKRFLLRYKDVIVYIYT